VDLKLRDKVALVTGSSRGIGESIARELGRNGCHVVLVSRDAERLQLVADEIRRDGVQALSIPADLKDPEAPERVVRQAAEAFGRLDSLVNCAGATKRGDFFQLTEDDWQSGFALKFFGTVRMCRAAWPHLKKARGAIVNIIGVAAHTPTADFTIGGPVNSALVNFTKALADIGRHDEVRVNCINPGYFDTTRLTQKLDQTAAKLGITRGEAGARLCRDIGVRRFGHVDELAVLTAFLLSDHAAYIEGASIDIDGGWTRGI